MKLGDSSAPPAHALTASGIFVRSRSSNYSFRSLSNRTTCHTPRLKNLLLVKEKVFSFILLPISCCFSPPRILQTPCTPSAPSAWTPGQHQSNPSNQGVRSIQSSNCASHQHHRCLGFEGRSPWSDRSDTFLCSSNFPPKPVLFFFSLSGFTIPYLSLQFFFPFFQKVPKSLLKRCL